MKTLPMRAPTIEADLRSRKLFQLVSRLRKIEMEVTLRIQVIHVAGTHMIAQGADGFSRGMMT